MVLCALTTATAMPETTQETCAPAKDSPFFIKNLLNCDSKQSKPKPALTATKAALDGGFSLSQVGDFNFPRFDLPAQRFSLPAHYLERTSAWWYPYALSSSSHIHRTEGKTETQKTATFHVYIMNSDKIAFEQDIFRLVGFGIQFDVEVAPLNLTVEQGNVH